MKPETRTIFEADCLSVLERFDNSTFMLVYLDPPWPTKDTPSKLSSKRPKSKPRIEEPAKREPSFLEYVAWLSGVVQQAYRVTASRGNVVLHVDPQIEGYLRLIINELLPDTDVARISLGVGRFQSRQPIPRDNQNSLLIVRRSAESVWNPPTRPLTQAEISKRYPNKDSTGRLYFLADLTRPAVSRTSFEWHGIKPPSGRIWRFSKERLDQLEREGRVTSPSAKRLPRLKVYADEQAGIDVGMNWSDIPSGVSMHERFTIGNKTVIVSGQQPIAILERLLAATTNPGDWVLDPMCGLGIVLAAAEMLGRRWVGAEENAEAVAFSSNCVKQLTGIPITPTTELSSVPVVRATHTFPQSSLCRDQPPRFNLNQPIPLEETRHYEFKEVKGGNPVGAIKNAADEYAVAFLNSDGGRILWGVRNEDRTAIGVPLNYRERDDVAKAVDSKLYQIQPSIPPSSWHLQFFPVYDRGTMIEDLWVVQLVVPRPSGSNVLYGTGSGDVFVKTASGKKKLSFSEVQAEVIRRNQKSAVTQ